MQGAGLLMCMLPIPTISNPGSGQYDYQGFAASLASAGYSKRVSVECNFQDFEAEVPQSICFLRNQFSA